MITAILNFLKPVWNWIFKFLISIIISNIIIWLLKYSISQFLNQFNTVITDWINQKSTEIMTTIIKIDEWLNQIFERIFNKIDELIQEVETEINDILTQITNNINSLIPDISNSDLIQTILQDASNTINQIITDLIAVIPLESLKILVSNAIAKAETLEQNFQAEMVQFWDSLTSPIQITIAQINNNLNNLTNTLNNPVNFCNKNIDALQSNMIAACNEIDNYNSALQQKKADVLMLIQTNQLERADLVDWFVFATPSTLNIDFSQYRTDPPSINRDDYLFNYALPSFNLVDLSHHLPDLTQIKTKWTSIYSNLSNINQNALNRLESQLPAILRGTIEAKIKALIVVAMAQAVYNLKTEITTKIDSKINTITQAKNEDKQEIVNDKQAIVNALQQFELSQYGNIERILSPTVQDLILDLTEGINANENSVQVNIDDVLPDTSQFNNILTTFSNIPANKDPNISDSKVWDIGDIYRILCNYFSRADRAALILLLFEQDLQLNESKIKDLQLAWTNTPNQNTQGIV
ncbi:MAG: hypothetical protein HQK63_00070 [Desulfamplus sp.]|nr:hypothetical protein [Desulfamplus sp.]